MTVYKWNMRDILSHTGKFGGVYCKIRKKRVVSRDMAAYFDNSNSGIHMVDRASYWR
jgi:hypothetical protein